MSSAKVKSILFYLSIPTALILLIVSGVYINEKVVNDPVQLPLQNQPPKQQQQTQINVQTPIFNQDFKLNQTISYTRNEQVLVDTGSGKTSINNIQNLTFYVLDVVKGHHTSMILKLTDTTDNKIDYFAFTINPTGQVIQFQYPTTTGDSTVQMARSTIFQFSPSLVKELYNQNPGAAPAYEKVGDMYVQFHRDYSTNTNDTITVSRKFGPNDIFNASSASKNFTFKEQTLFNKSNGIMQQSDYVQTFFLDNQLGQFTSPSGTASSSQNVAPSFNLTTVVNINKLQEESDFLVCQQSLFFFKMQGNLITETDILQSQSTSQLTGTSRLLAAASTATNNNNQAQNNGNNVNINSLKNISLFDTNLFGCKFSIEFGLSQQPLPYKGRKLYIFQLNIILGEKRRRILQKRLFSASADMTPNKTRNRILKTLGLPFSAKQRQMRNVVKLDIDEIFNMTQIISPQTNLQIKLLINTDFGYNLDILNFVEAVEQQIADPVTKKIYNKSVLTTAWRKLEERIFNSSFNIKLNISMKANFRMKVPGGNIIMNTTASLLNASAQLILSQQFNFQLNSLKFLYQVAFGKVKIITYLNTKSCVKKVCTELSTPQSSYDLFDGTNSESKKEDDIEKNEKQESDQNISEEQQEEEEKKEEKDIEDGGDGQPELKPENEEQNQKKTCDITDQKCFSEYPCGCKIFPTITQKNSCPDFKKGLDNGCSLTEPMIDYDFIRCNSVSCNIPYITVNKDTCQAKQDGTFKIGMDFEIDDLDAEQIKALAAKNGINPQNILNIISNFNNKKGIDDPNMQSINTTILTDNETNFINYAKINETVVDIQKYFDKLSQEATQNQQRLFIELPRSIRTVLYYFYSEFTEQEIRDSTFLSELNTYFLLQKWKQAIDLCYSDQTTCNSFNLNSTISLMRYACTMCDQTTQVQADVVMIMDASGSISDPDFEKERAFVENLTDSLTLNNSLMKVGLIQFSTSSTIESYLSSNRTSILTILKNLKKISGSTYTDLAFKDSYKIYKANSTDLMKKILFILTDGQSNGGSWTQILADVKNLGVNIFSVGVGSGISYNELNAFASSPDNVFVVSNFSVLQLIKGTLQKEVCFGTIPLNSSLEVAQVQQKAGSYSYFAFEYDPTQGKTITIDPVVPVTNSSNTDPTTSSTTGTSSTTTSSTTSDPTSSSTTTSTTTSAGTTTSATPSSTDSSTNSNNNDNNGNHYGEIKNNKTVAYFSETEKYPNEFNNDGVGVQLKNGSIQISKEKQGYDSSSSKGNGKKRIMQTTSSKFYVSILSAVDQNLTVKQQNFTQQILPCPVNCSICNAMGSICYLCENSTFLYNSKCYFQNERLQQIVLQEPSKENIIQLQQIAAEDYKVNYLSLVGLIFSSIYLTSIFGYMLYQKITKKFINVKSNQIVDEKFNEKVKTVVLNETQSVPINISTDQKQDSVLY